VRGSIRSLAFATAGVVALATAGGAGAATLLNGNFSSNNGNGQINYTSHGGTTYEVSDWTVGGNASNSYDFVFNTQTGTTSGSSADNSGATGGQGNDPGLGQSTLKLWGPGTSESNGFVEDPGGGAIIGVDPDFQSENNAISQTVTGLTSGQSYTVSFYWAGAQQSGFTGATSEGWTVDFGGQSDSTGNTANSSKGFTGWTLQSYTFTADGTSDLLSFIATGTGGSALPPFSLLADVSVTPVGGVPEPATWAMMLLVIGGLGGALRMRRKQLFAAA